MPKTDRSGFARLLLLAAAVALCATAAQAQFTAPPTGPNDPITPVTGLDDPTTPPTPPTGPNDPTTPTNGYDDGDAPDGYGTADRGLPTQVRIAPDGRFEWVVIGPTGQSDAVSRAIEAAGGTVIRTTTLDALRQTTTIATFPAEINQQAAANAIAEDAPDSSLAPHHLYFLAQARQPRIYAPMLIGEAAPGNCRLARPVTIGMIDGPVNTRHPALRGVDITYESLSTRDRQPDANHGTAVAVLMVGEDPSGLLAGFARGARLHAISVFSDTDEREETTVEAIATAIDRLAGQGVRLINLSLAGPQNAALGRAVTVAAARGVVMIAASGNDRRPFVAWPAAAPEVIAVTAVDARRRRFARANTGPDIEFSAPGVDVYAAQARGAGYVSGTSFAAPIVTALAARHMARGAGSVAAVRAVLRDGVEILGPGTRNTDFGYGLVRSDGC